MILAVFVPVLITITVATCKYNLANVASWKARYSGPQCTLIQPPRSTSLFFHFQLIPFSKQRQSTSLFFHFQLIPFIKRKCINLLDVEHTEEVSQHWQCSDAQSSERSCCRNVTIQFVNHRLLTMSTHDHLLFLQLLRHLPSHSVHAITHTQHLLTGTDKTTNTKSAHLTIAERCTPTN